MVLKAEWSEPLTKLKQDVLFCLNESNQEAKFSLTKSRSEGRKTITIEKWTADRDSVKPIQAICITPIRGPNSSGHQISGSLKIPFLDCFLRAKRNAEMHFTLSHDTCWTLEKHSNPTTSSRKIKDRAEIVKICTSWIDKRGIPWILLIPMVAGVRLRSIRYQPNKSTDGEVTKALLPGVGASPLPTATHNFLLPFLLRLLSHNNNSKRGVVQGDELICPLAFISRN